MTDPVSGVGAKALAAIKPEQKMIQSRALAQNLRVKQALVLPRTWYN